MILLIKINKILNENLIKAYMILILKIGIIYAFYFFEKLFICRKFLRICLYEKGIEK